MEANNQLFGMLDLIPRPAFCVKENRIIHANQAAQGLLLVPGTEIRPLLLTGQQEYGALEKGCLYLKLDLSAKGCGAAVTRQDGMDTFLLDQEADDAQLRCLALAAAELRGPLTSILISAEKLLAQSGPDSQVHAARLNRGLHQMLRMVGNMSDAGHMAASSRQELKYIGTVFSEIFQKAQALVDQAGITMTYQGLKEDVLCLLDEEQLERAVLNILSNAVKFTPANGTIAVSLTRQGQMLRLSIQDSGSGIAESVRSSIFSRYLRQPGIEDGRHGIGLGMVLIRSAAANHGGTVLIDQPQGTGTRITMTLALRQDSGNQLRSPIMRVDYAGERDHGLIELSDCLPVSVYEQN